jgi:hypothetical protein
MVKSSAGELVFTDGDEDIYATDGWISGKDPHDL